jgi:hypothetical protein
MKQYTIPEFSQKIRAQYPGSYDDLSDDKLIELWLNKYPNDKEHIIEETNNGNSWLFYLIIIALIAGGVYFYNNHNISTDNRDELSNASSSSEQQTSTVNQFENGSSETNPEQDFPITSEAEQLFSDNPIFEIIKIDYDTKNTLLQILSDPNPDPDNIENQWSENTSIRCIYCNNKVPGVYCSYQKYLYDNLRCGSSDTGLMSNLALSFGFGYCANARLAIAYGNTDKTGFTKESTDSEGNPEIDWEKFATDNYKRTVFELEPILAEICSNYKNGNRYFTLDNPVTDGSKKFCSEKCKTEYKYSH